MCKGGGGSGGCPRENIQKMKSEKWGGGVPGNQEPIRGTRLVRYNVPPPPPPHYTFHVSILYLHLQRNSTFSVLSSRTVHHPFEA